MGRLLLMIGVCALPVMTGCAPENEAARLTVHARAVRVDVSEGPSLSNVQAELDGTNARLVTTSARLAVLETVPNAQVRLYGVLGYGTTATCIRRFQVVLEDMPTDSIVYADDLAGGASFTIDEAGTYSMSYTDQAPAQYSFGFTRNATALDQSITSAPLSSLITYTTVNGGGVAQATNVSATLRLLPGDVIRPHTTCDSSAADGAGAVFVITRVSR